MCFDCFGKGSAKKARLNTPPSSSSSGQEPVRGYPMNKDTPPLKCNNKSLLKEDVGRDNRSNNLDAQDGKTDLPSRKPKEEFHNNKKYFNNEPLKKSQTEEPPQEQIQDGKKYARNEGVFTRSSTDEPYSSNSENQLRKDIIAPHSDKKSNNKDPQKETPPKEADGRDSTRQVWSDNFYAQNEKMTSTRTDQPSRKSENQFDRHDAADFAGPHSSDKKSNKEPPKEHYRQDSSRRVSNFDAQNEQKITPSSDQSWDSSDDLPKMSSKDSKYRH